jgi:hypothetical protein
MFALSILTASAAEKMRLVLPRARSTAPENASRQIIKRKRLHAKGFGANLSIISEKNLTKMA